MWLTDPKNNKKSVTLTLMVIANLIANLKLLLSGIEYNGFKLSEFTGESYAMVIAAAGGIYAWRKSQGIKGAEDENEAK